MIQLEHLPQMAPRHLVLSVALVFLLAARQGYSDDWPQFRGPNCGGISYSELPLPVEFSETEGVRWTAAVGEGVGCPAVAAGRAFVGGMIDEETVALIALDVDTGRELWRRTWIVSQLAEIQETNSHASTTPAADADRVYFYFSTLGLCALDAKTGTDVWHKALPTPFFIFKWGPAISPVLYKDMVLFVQDDDLYPAMFAFEKATGDLIWKDKRHDMAVNYSHPVVCHTDRGDEIVVAGTGLLIGYDPQSGERLWHAKTLLRNIKTTPVSFDGIVYISLQSGGIANQWLAVADRIETGNNDGKLTKAEMQASVGESQIPDEFFEKTFGRGDRNQDGYLEGVELDVAFLHPDNFSGARFDAEDSAEQYILAVRGGGRGDVTDTHLLWKHPTKFTDHVVSPLVLDGRMLLVKGGGISTVFDTQRGEPLRGAKRIGNASDYFASPVHGDGKIYVAGENGVVVVLKNSPDYEVLAKNDMGDSIVGTPAIADGRLLIRTRSKLICVGE